MPTHVALLRGINVGKAKQVAMADLAAAVESCGYDDVKTLLRSGNVVFTGPARLPAGAADRLEAALLARTGVRSSFVLLGAAELAAALEADPLRAVATDPARELLTFLDAPPAAGTAAPAADEIAPDRVVLGGRVVYSWHPDGVARSRVSPAWWKGLDRVITARNRSTAEKLLALARG